MNALTLQWHDAGKEKTQKIYEQQPSKNHGTVRIGRDPLRCDIVLSHPTVSGLHVEIYFHSSAQRFFIRNLREQNPPLVDGKQLLGGEFALSEGSIIYLGQQELKVTAVSIPAAYTVPETILAPPQPQAVNPQRVTPIAQHHPQLQVLHHNHPQTPPVQPQGVYGLECPRCHKVSSAEYLQVGCPWCGTSLAAAVSVLVSG